VAPELIQDWRLQSAKQALHPVVTINEGIYAFSPTYQKYREGTYRLDC
jgi:hypothetical protein